MRQSGGFKSSGDKMGTILKFKGIDESNKRKKKKTNKQVHYDLTEVLHEQ